MESGLSASLRNVSKITRGEPRQKEKPLSWLSLDISSRPICSVGFFYLIYLFQEVQRPVKQNDFVITCRSMTMKFLRDAVENKSPDISTGKTEI